MLKQHLHENWTVRATGNLAQIPPSLRNVTIPARVPGCVHTDLLRAGLIPDPYRDFNEHQLQWIGETDWQYTLVFEANDELFEHERIDLVCDGLDTVATIELNGQHIAKTENMFRGYRFDVRGALKRGSNELSITFTSPVRYVERMRDTLGERPYVGGRSGAFPFIRKMACNFGWDWGPALTTCGIWRGIRLEAWSQIRIATVRTFSEFRSCELAVEVDYEFASPIQRTSNGYDVFVHVTHSSGRVTSEGGKGNNDAPTERIELTLNDCEYWFPAGHGAQPLYEVKVSVEQRGETANAFDEWRGRIGRHTIQLDTSPDDIGRKFVLKVNGEPLFCKGFNWIPDDAFLNRANDLARLRTRIQQAVDCGANMLRVWGGGIYETDEFYDICDELGVLVWQDFPFACAMYSEDEPLWSEVEAEARYNVARLARHPSLALYNGCNENIWAYRDWGWGPQVQDKSWGKNYYFDLLPRVVKEVDPSKPYWAGSPWSGDFDVDHGVTPNAPTHGNMHIWEIYFRQDYPDYRTITPRFVSEFGYQSPATYSSIAGIIKPEDRDFGSPAMRDRQRHGNAATDDGDRKNLRWMSLHFNVDGLDELMKNLEPIEPEKVIVPPSGQTVLQPARVLPSRANFDDVHYLLQLNHARAMQTAVEWFRSRQPACMGTLYWQFNDHWPAATSCSAVDGDGRLKPLWYATRKFYASELLTIQPEADGVLHLNRINDRDVSESRRVRVVRRRFDGTILAQQEIELSGGKISRVALDETITTPEDPSEEVIVAGNGPGRAMSFFDVDKKLRYPAARYETELVKTQTGYDFTIRAASFLRDIVLNVDRIDPDAIASEQIVTLFPGEAFTFSIQTNKTFDNESLSRPPVFQSVNRFGKIE
jgi:beta-mannosidase